MINRKAIAEEILASFHTFKRKFAAEGHVMSKEYGITPVQMSVLFAVKHNDGISVREVAGSLGVTRSAATQLIDGLVKNDFLVREDNDKDRRTINLHLTEKSKKHMTMMKNNMMKKFLTVFDSLEDEDLLRFNELVKKINQPEKTKEEV